MLNFKNAFAKGHYFLDKSNNVWLYKDFYLHLSDGVYLYLAFVTQPNYVPNRITAHWRISAHRLIGLSFLHEQLVDNQW